MFQASILVDQNPQSPFLISSYIIRYTLKVYFFPKTQQREMYDADAVHQLYESKLCYVAITELAHSLGTSLHLLMIAPTSSFLGCVYTLLSHFAKTALTAYFRFQPSECPQLWKSTSPTPHPYIIFCPTHLQCTILIKLFGHK